MSGPTKVMLSKIWCTRKSAWLFQALRPVHPVPSIQVGQIREQLLNLRVVDRQFELSRATAEPLCQIISIRWLRRRHFGSCGA
jgi:hypothetical protein